MINNLVKVSLLLVEGSGHAVRLLHVHHEILYLALKTLLRLLQRGALWIHRFDLLFSFLQALSQLFPAESHSCIKFSQNLEVWKSKFKVWCWNSFFQRKKSKWRVRFSILILIFLWTDPLIDGMVTLPPRALRCAGWRQSRICSSTAPPPCWPSTNSAAAQLWPPAPPRTAHGADRSRVGPTANCEPERSLPVKRTPTERLMGKKVKQKTVLTQGRNNNVYLGGALIIFTQILVIYNDGKCVVVSPSFPLRWIFSAHRSESWIPVFLSSAEKRGFLVPPFVWKIQLSEAKKRKIGSLWNFNEFNKNCLCLFEVRNE